MGKTKERELIITLEEAEKHWSDVFEGSDYTTEEIQEAVNNMYHPDNSDDDEDDGLPEGERIVDLDKQFADKLNEADHELFWSLSGLERHVVRKGDLTLKDIRKYRKENK